MEISVATLRQNGLRISGQVSDEQVNKAAREAIDCYVSKVLQIYVENDVDVWHATMQLVFIILARRDTIVTRAGAKDKSSPSLSVDASVRQVDLEEADRLLRKLQTKPAGIQGLPSKLVDDIAHIYYRNEFISL